MDVESLQSFITVVREKSISKAAQSLHVSQPTLSARIHKLEQDLNFKLIERSWKGVELTKEGRYFLPCAAESLHSINNVHTVLTSTLRKEEKRTYQEAVNNSDQILLGIESWLVPLFSKYILEELKKVPEIKYKIVTHPTPIILELLELGILDLGIFYGGKEQLKPLSTPIIEDEMILLYSSEIGGINSDFSNTIVLKDKPFLLFDNPILVHHSNFTDQILQQFNVEQIQVTDNINVMIQMIELDLGYTIVPKSSVFNFLPLIDSGLLEIGYQFIGNRLESTTIQIAYNSSDFVQFSTSEMAKNLFIAFNEKSKMLA